MNKATLARSKKSTDTTGDTLLLSPEQKVLRARSAFGVWQRPLKESLRAMATIRKGLDRPCK